MPRKRKFNVKRHPNGKPKLDKTKDSGSEYLLAQRARAFGWKNIKDPMASDTDPIGNLKLLGHIDEEQHRALSRLRSLFDLERGLRSTLWDEWQDAVGIEQKSPHPKLHPKTMNLDGKKHGKKGSPDITRLLSLKGEVSSDISHIRKNVHVSVIQLACYGEVMGGTFSRYNKQFTAGVQWLIDYFQKETGRKAY
jgi:hypothetical protein